MQKRLTIFVAVVCAAAVCALTWLIHSEGAGAATLVLSEVAGVLALIGLAAEMLTFALPHGGAGSIAFIPFIAVALATPSWIAPAAVGLTMVVTECLRRRALEKAAFNVAQAIVALSFGVAIYRLLGGPEVATSGAVPLRELATAAFFPAAALLCVVVLVNTCLVSAVIAISSGKSMLQVWRANTLSTLSYYLITGPIAFVLAWAYSRGGPLGAAAVALPMLGVRQLYSITTQLQRTNQELLEMMVKAIEARDPYTSGHSRRVSDYSVTIARIIGVSESAVERVRIAGLLHDVGKIHESFAPILRKPGRLTADEWMLMKTHPEKGAELIGTLSHLQDLVPAIRHHHERWDGGGYPDGVQANQIPIIARIIMFADTMDAMLSDRPYRSALTEVEVRAEVLKNRGTQFDPAMCDALLRSVQFSELIAHGAQKERTRSTPSGVRVRPSTSHAVLKSGAI